MARTIDLESKTANWTMEVRPFKDGPSKKVNVIADFSDCPESRILDLACQTVAITEQGRLRRMFDSITNGQTVRLKVAESSKSDPMLLLKSRMATLTPEQKAMLLEELSK